MFKLFGERTKAGGTQPNLEIPSHKTNNFNDAELGDLKQLSDAVKARTEEVTNTNKAAIVEQFSENGVDIKGSTWAKMYDAAWESDDPTTKDENFRGKVLNAINKWNRINPDDRHAYLEYTDSDFLSLSDDTDFNDDDLSVMTAARLLAEKRPDDNRTYEKPEEEKEKPEEEPEEEAQKPKEEPEEDPKEGPQKPKEQPEPENNPNQWGDPDEILPPVQALYPTPTKRPSIQPTMPSINPIASEPSRLNPIISAGPRGPITPHAWPKRPVRREEMPSIKAVFFPKFEPKIPSFSFDAAPAIGPDAALRFPRTPEIDPITEGLKKRVKRIKEIIPPAPDPTPEFVRQREERKHKVIDFIKKIPVGLLLLACLVNPFAPKKEAGKVNIQAQRESIVQTVVPEQTTQVEHEIQVGDEGYAEKMMNDLKIGDSIYVPGGKTYQESSYGVAQHPGVEGEDYGTVGQHPLSPAGYYTVNRADSFDTKDVEAGHKNYISEEDGNTGTAIRETVTEGVDNAMPIIHLNGENSTTTRGERGWIAMKDVKDAAIVEKDGSLRTYTEVENVTTPEHVETSTQTIEVSGEASTDSNKLSFETDGQQVSIDLYNPDGSALQAGEAVIGSDGQHYEITGVSATEGEEKMKLSLKNVLTNVTLIVTAAGLTAAQYYALSRRRES